MPVNPGILSLNLKALMLANPAIGAVDGAALTGLCDAIASAVLTHLTTLAVVVPPGGGAPIGQIQ